MDDQVQIANWHAQVLLTKPAPTRRLLPAGVIIASNTIGKSGVRWLGRPALPGRGFQELPDAYSFGTGQYWKIDEGQRRSPSRPRRPETMNPPDRTSRCRQQQSQRSPEWPRHSNCHHQTRSTFTNYGRRPPAIPSDANQFQFQTQSLRNRFNAGEFGVTAIFEVAHRAWIGNTGELGNRIPR